jgi:uncharacterized membrane protein YbhN (UPF0104 family)
MKKKIGLGAAICAFLALAAWAMQRVHFDWPVFWQQIRHAEPGHLLLGLVTIYAGYWLRAVRWAVFLRPQKHVPSKDLIGTQVIGFTAVALFGRLTDLVRPYLVARRTGLTVSSQLAVYAVERMFDALSMALILSLTLAVSPDAKTLPHHEAFIRTGWLGLAAALLGGCFALLVRLRGERIAGMVERGLHPLSAKLAEAARHRILAFREGMNVLRGLGDFALALGCSLLMWSLIIASYVFIIRAFPDLYMLNFSRIMVMMVTGMGGSIFQLPVLGWFTQIGVVSLAMKGLGAPLEPSIGAGALLLLITFMGVIPLGLIYARIEHVSLRKVAHESEELEVAALRP